jgi:hypothetical protein
MLGEITPTMASAIGESDAQKILIPINKCNLTVIGVKDMQFGEYITEAIASVRLAQE